VNIKPEAASDGCCSGVEFNAFDLKSIAGVDPQAATLITTDIEKPPRPAPLVKRYVTIDRGPKPI